MAEENERLWNRCRLTQVISFFFWSVLALDLYRPEICGETQLCDIDMLGVTSLVLIAYGLNYQFVFSLSVCLSQNQDFSLLSLLFSCLFEQMRQTERGVCWIRRCTGLKTAALFWSAVLNPSVPLFTGSFRDMERTANKRYVLLCIQWRPNDHEMSA